MAERSINAAIKSKLVANEPFQYAHLVKFERPFDPKDGVFRTNTNRYAYYTDAAHDITFSGNTYRANRITSIGQYSETTTARASTMNLTLAAEDLGAKVVVTGAITVATVDSVVTGTFTPSATVIDGEPLDFVEKGFKEGDKLLFTLTQTAGSFIVGSRATILSAGNTDFTAIGAPNNTVGTTFTVTGAGSGTGTATIKANYIISSFETNNTIIKFVAVGDTGDSDVANLTAVSSTSFTVTLDSEELTAVLQDRGITIDSTTAASPSFVNRKVEVHKVFLEPDTGALIGSTSIMVFKGIIASVSIQESPTKTQVKWSLTSHWGDFEAVQGRVTTDEIHRALNPDGSPSTVQSIRPEYASDLGFLHSETSLSTIANYKTYETKYRMKKKRRGGLAGLFGGKYYVQEEYQEEVDNEVDLNIHLSGKELPIVYGVQRVEGIPIFADTLDSDSKQVYIAHAICEGEIHGLYNLYIDDVPIICTDDNDFDVRNVTSSEASESQLQCYGNMSHGNTLNATVAELNEIKANVAAQIAAASSGTGGMSSGSFNEYMMMQQAAMSQYKDMSGVSIATLSAGHASGMQHEESFAINHPYNIEWNFFSGRANQTASNKLVSVAENTTAGQNFKRQSDYYTGNLPYWAENHRLLDTAYAVSKFTIDADATEVPEVEYIVKGRVLECYNYDDSYIPDVVLGASDNASNFTEGDLVTVEYSANGSSWTTDTSGDWTNNAFKILDKYTFTTSRGTQHTRFRLDKTPSLSISNGTPTQTYLRLKSGSNYWHMITWNHGLVTTADDDSFPNNWQTVTTWSKNGSNELTAAVSDSVYTALGTDDMFFQFRKSTWDSSVSGLQYGVLRGVWSGSAGIRLLTFPNTDFSLLDDELDGTKLARASILPFNVDIVDDVTNVAEIEGAILKNTTTGEEREITDFNTTTKNITIETPFFTPPTEAHKFTITGRGRDLRASSNPAIQTLDYLRSKRFGKDLEDDDLDLDSFISAAKLCDTRSDITISVASVSGVAVNDIFTLTHNGQSGGNHVASGKVSSIDATNNTITLTQVINKFAKQWSTFTTVVNGDIVYTDDNKFYRSDGTTLSGTSVPTHTSGTTNGLAYIGNSSSGGNITIYKTAGNGTASSLNYVKTGIPIEYSLYDADWIKYWRYYGWEQHHQRWVTRHQTNFIIDTGKSVFANMNALLSHYNGILSYENGKYVLDVETQETAPTASLNASQENTNPFYIESSDIIGSISVKDNSQRVAKNTIKASIADPQNNYGSRSVTFFNSDFLEADRNVIKTGQFPFTGITNYYNARINTEKELFQTRFSKEISFTVGPRGILLRAGEVIALTYEPFGWTSKLFRIENLTFKADCNVSIKAREYDDSIYEITKQRAAKIVKESSGQFALKAPLAPGSAAGTGDDLTATTNKNGSVILGWGNATDYNEVSDSTEIWYSSDNNRANATLLATVDNATSYSHTPAVAETKYYWVRHRRISSLTQSNARTIVHSPYHPTSATGGVVGTSLSISAGATSIKLLPSSHVIDYTKVGTETTSITFTTDIQGMEGTIYYDFLVGATSKQNTTTSTWTLPDGDEPGPEDAPIKITVKARQGTNNGTLLAQDIVSIYAVQDGQSVVTGILTNEAHTVPAAVDGAVSSFSGAGGTYLVYYGNDKIQDIAGYQASDLVFSVQATTGTVTAAINATTGVYSISALGSDAATVTFRAIVKGSMIGGVDTTNDVTRDKVYTIAKAKVGATGAGTAGLNQSTVSLYYLNNDTGTTPAHPDSDLTYTFADKELTVPDGHATLDDWTQAFPDTTATNGVRWVTMAVASSNSSTDDIEVADWSDPVVIGDDKNIRHAKVDLFQRAATNSAPADPNGDLTWTFDTGVLSGSNFNDWTTEIEPTGGAYVFMISAVALGNAGATTATIETGDWSAAALLTSPGAVGANAKTVQLTVDDYSIVYAADGTTPSPSGNMTLTATSQNFDNAYFKFTGDGITDEGSYTDGSGANADTFTFAIPTSHFTTPKSLKVSVQEGNSGGEVAFDTITITAVKPGTSGIDGITVVNTNSAHAFPASITGNIANADYANSGTTLEVYEGATALAYDGTGTNNSTWKIVATTQTNITVGNFTDNGNTVTVGSHSGVADGTDVSKIIYTITGKRSNGDAISTTTEQTFTKSKKGDTGDEGVGFAEAWLEAASEPATPNNNTNPPTSPVTWYSSIAAAEAAGSGLLWKSAGTKAAGSTSWSWGAPEAVVRDARDIGVPYQYVQAGIPNGASATPPVKAGDIWLDSGNGYKRYVAMTDNSDAITLITASTLEWVLFPTVPEITTGTGDPPAVGGRNPGDIHISDSTIHYVLVDR